MADIPTRPGGDEGGGRAHPCPACGGAARRRLMTVRTRSEYNVIRCRCGFVFTVPRPTPAELDEFYSSDYFINKQETNFGYAGYEMGELNSLQMWAELNRYAPTDLIRPRAVLDVGCATGGFLYGAKQAGWACTGVELAPDAVRRATEHFGLEVYRDDIFCPRLAPGTFGLVTMWHVLEHLIDPRAAVERCRELLAQGGRLFVELPNWNSAGRLTRGRAWGQLRPPEHINFFTPRSLSALMARGGLRVLRASTHHSDAADRVVRRLVPRLVDRAAPWLAPRATQGLTFLACRAGCGGYLRVLAERV